MFLWMCTVQAIRSGIHPADMAAVILHHHLLVGRADHRFRMTHASRLPPGYPAASGEQPPLVLLPAWRRDQGPGEHKGRNLILPELLDIGECNHRPKRMAEEMHQTWGENLFDRMQLLGEPFRRQERFVNNSRRLH